MWEKKTYNKSRHITSSAAVKTNWHLRQMENTASKTCQCSHKYYKDAKFLCKTNFAPMKNSAKDASCNWETLSSFSWLVCNRNTRSRLRGFLMSKMMLRYFASLISWLLFRSSTHECLLYFCMKKVQLYFVYTRRA